MTVLKSAALLLAGALAMHSQLHAQSANQIEYFGYYYYSADMEGGQSFDVNTLPRDVLGSEANVVMTLPNDFVSLVDNKKLRGVKAILTQIISFGGLRRASDPCLITNDWSAYNSWKNGLSSALTAAASPQSPVISDYVAAFDLQDEPYHTYKASCNATQITNLLSAAAAKLKADFPSIPVMIVESREFVTDVPNSFPAELDWIGFDCYSGKLGVQNCSGAHQRSLLTTLKSKMTAAQRIVIVAQTSQELSYDMSGTQFANLGQQYLALALSEPRTIAVLGFTGDRRYHVRTDMRHGSIRCYDTSQGPCNQAYFNGNAPARTVYEKFLANVVRRSSSNVLNIVLGKPVIRTSTSSTPQYETPATNLVDGNDLTQAYPGTNSFEYTIDLQGLFKATDFRLVLNGYGYSTPYQYINNWTLTGVRFDGSTVDLAVGTTPPTGEAAALDLGHVLSSVPENAVIGAMISPTTSGSVPIKALKLWASAPAHWIGAYELRVHGYSAPNLALNKPVTALLPTYAPYTFPNTNITDGNPSTFGYPNSAELHYEVDLGSSVSISRIRARVNGWGYSSPYKYITEYKVEIVPAGANAVPIVVASGGVPNADVIDVATSITGQKVRFLAKSTGAGSNWFGLYELEVY